MLTNGTNTNLKSWQRIAQCKILCDFKVQCIYEIHVGHRRLGLITMDKREMRMPLILDVAVPGDNGVRVKELEKINRYKDLKREFITMWT